MKFPFLFLLLLPFSVFGQKDSVYTSLEDAIKNLESLDIWEDQLKDIPQSLEKLTKLKKFYIHGEKVSKEKVDQIRNKLPNIISD